MKPVAILSNILQRDILTNEMIQRLHPSNIYIPLFVFWTGGLDEVKGLYQQSYCSTGSLSMCVSWFWFEPLRKTTIYCLSELLVIFS